MGEPPGGLLRGPAASIKSSARRPGGGGECAGHRQIWFSRGAAGGWARRQLQQQALFSAGWLRCVSWRRRTRHGQDGRPGPSQRISPSISALGWRHLRQYISGEDLSWEVVSTEPAMRSPAPAQHLQRRGEPPAPTPAGCAGEGGAGWRVDRVLWSAVREGSPAAAAEYSSYSCSTRRPLAEVVGIWWGRRSARCSGGSMWRCRLRRPGQQWCGGGVGYAGGQNLFPGGAAGSGGCRQRQCPAESQESNTLTGGG